MRIVIDFEVVSSVESLHNILETKLINVLENFSSYIKLYKTRSDPLAICSIF
jgi:hypothetical protein